MTVSELQLACDFCSALVPDPWHGSTLEKKHIHACEKCLHLLPGHGIAPHGLQLVPTTTNPFIAAACDQSSQVCALESPTPVSIFADVDECMVVLRPPFNSVIKMPELAGWNRWSLKEKAEAIRQITMSRDVDDIEIDTAGIGIGLYQLVCQFFPGAEQRERVPTQPGNFTPLQMSEKELLGRIRENCISQAAAEKVAAAITTDPVALQALREHMHKAFRIPTESMAVLVEHSLPAALRLPLQGV